MRRFLATLLLTATTLVPAIAADPAPEKPEVGTFGFDEAGMDRSVKPGDDFFLYANGGWIRDTSIPDDKPLWGSYMQLRDLSSQRLRSILEADPASKIGRAYASYIDGARVEQLGLDPIKPWLARIRAVRDRSAFTALLADAARMGVQVAFTDYAWEDDKRPQLETLTVEQGGIGMPDRDMYLADIPAFVKLRAAYVAHLSRLLTLAGEPDADARAGAVMALETEIARGHWQRDDVMDMAKAYNLYKIADLSSLSSATVDLPAYFRRNAPKLTEVLIREPSAMKAITAAMDKAPLQAAKDQLLLRSLEVFSGVLPDAIGEETFAFYGTALTGSPQRSPRWQRGVSFVDMALRDDLGQQYVARYFPPENKAKMTELAHNLLAVFADRIDKLDWMSAETKVRAKAKLANFTVRVGYPDQWRDYSKLEIRDGDLFGNFVRAKRFAYQYNIDYAEQPVRRWEWYFSPATVNANANYSQLFITFPAAFLQPPIFDPNADPAVNYGAIGAVAGHEISHNFDNNGSLYNEKGELSTWWTPEDLAAFKAASQALVSLYDSYEPLPGEHVRGQFTLTENIGDLGGLSVAYDAYKRSLGGKPAPVINGLTGDQRFFLGWAQFYRIKEREAYARQALLTDSHSPAAQRTWAVRNIDAWYDAFGVRPGDKLYLPPEKRIRIW